MASPLILLTVALSLPTAAPYAKEAAELDKRLAAMRKAGEPTTLAELGRLYPDPAPGQNAAPLLTKAFALLDGREDPPALMPLLPIVGTAELGPPNENVPPPMRKAIREYLGDRAEALELLHKAAKRKGCKFDLDFEQGLALPLPHLAKIRQACRVLALEVVERAEDGQTEKATDSIVALLRAATALRNEPILVSALVRAACIGIATGQIERWACRARPGPELLERIGAALKDEADPAMMQKVMVAERCFGMDVYQNQILKPGGQEVAAALGMDGPKAIMLRLMPPNFFKADMLAYVPRPPAAEEAPAARTAEPAAKAAATKPSRTTAPAASPAAAGPVLAATAAPPYEVPAAPMAGSRLMVTPRARKVAREHNVGWRFLVGSGPNGRIRERDVLAYEAEVKPVATPAAMKLAADRHVDIRQVPPTGPGGRVSEDDVRRAEPSLIAGGFERHEMSAKVDMSAAAALRQGLKDEGTKVSFNDLLVRAVALALRDFPDVASLYDSGTLIRRGGLHVGIAVALDEGLIVPVVKDADKKTLVELSVAAKDLVSRARSNKLTPDEYTGGVITVSNLGMLGIDEFTAIVNPGESAIVACGTITETVLVVDGEFAARPMMKVTGSFDHRATDGAVGARFLAKVRELLEAPEGLA